MKRRSDPAEQAQEQKTLSEGVVATGEHARGKNGLGVPREDYSDYVFMNPRKHKNKHHHSHRSRRRRKRIKKVLLTIGCVLLSLVTLLVGSAVFLFFKGQSELMNSEINIVAPDSVDASLQNDGRLIIYNGSQYRLNEDITSLLFIGVDKRDMDDIGELGASGQADVIVLIAIDTKTGEMKMVNVPRDTMTDVAVYAVEGTYVGMKHQQICLSYAYGDGKETSCDNTVAAVKRIFYNIPINSYFAMDIDGIGAINDAVGGIDVVSPETVETFEKGESYHLEGRTAERFVRARNHETADANLLRNKRQQLYADAFVHKIFSATKEDLTTPVSLFNASAPYSVTNLNPSRITFLAQKLVSGGSVSMTMTNVPGTAALNKEEYAEYTVNEKEFYEVFLNTFYKKVT